MICMHRRDCLHSDDAVYDRAAEVTCQVVYHDGRSPAVVAVDDTRLSTIDEAR